MFNVSNKEPVQLFKSGTRAYSEVYGSRELASYRLGRPDGSIVRTFAISKREAVEVVKNLPAELKQEAGLVNGEFEVEALTDEQLEDIKQHHNLIVNEPMNMEQLPEELLEQIKAHYRLISIDEVQEQLKDGVMGKNQFKELVEEETGATPEEDSEPEQEPKDDSEPEKEVKEDENTQKDPKKNEETDKVAENKGSSSDTVDSEGSLDIESMSHNKLKKLAQELEVEGRTKMNKKQLQEAILKKVEEDDSE